MVVVASTPAFSNVCKAVGASIRVLDLRNISQKDLIWITEEVDLILATRDFAREELERITVPRNSLTRYGWCAGDLTRDAGWYKIRAVFDLQTQEKPNRKDA